MPLLAGAVALGAAAAVVYLRPAPVAQLPAGHGTGAIPAVVRPVPPTGIEAGTPIPPSFDIVRIGPDGQAVIAGRAAPGAEVMIQDHGQALGTVKADSHGSWVFLPPEPLPAGPRQLRLSERTEHGNVSGQASAVLVVPPSNGTPQALPAIAMLATPGAAPRVLQAPGKTRDRLALDAMDYGQNGRDARFSGSAPPGAVLRLYVDNGLIGQATAGPDGSWSLATAVPIAPGQHELRLDQIGADANAIARVVLPFSREAAAPALPENGIVVQRGFSLWRIARQVYGSGTRYTVIYQANRETIQDPSRIYPGQVLTLPTVQ